MPSRGKFITFEGLDGCGKSTQVKKLAAFLRARGMHVVVTREPGGTPTGEKIRNLLLDTRTTGLAPRAELALMFAARAHHIEEVIEPALTNGQIVLCDRFTDSTEAYQGGGRKLGKPARPDFASRSLRRAAAGSNHPYGFRSRGQRGSSPPPQQADWKNRSRVRREPLRAGEP